MLDNLLGQNIKKYRKNKKMSQKELARETGLSTSYIQQLELAQKKSPSFEVLLKISKALNVLVTDLNPNLKKDKSVTQLFNGPGLYVLPKNDTKDILEFIEERPKFTENEIIEMLIDSYNDDIFDRKYDTEKLTEKQIEDLKPVIRGIVEITLNKCVRNK
ncbi:UNVERIFIED_ORG: hypothetical protein B2H93_03270 [Clostridium botulinum]